MITSFELLLATATVAATPTPVPPSTFADDITVVASRFELSIDDAPGSVVALGRERLELAPGPALDETLRQVPGFALFRRAGSRTANPTSQGVSLRGVGASGASRAVVLWDGIPLGDPFGGWVYWSRVPRAAVDRVEILRGGGSSLYGSGALGGAVRLFRREAAERDARIEASIASLQTPEASAFARTVAGPWRLDVAGEYFRTEGYPILDPAVRGTADIEASSRHATGEIAAARAVGRHGRAFVRLSLFDERRGNGTPLQVNDTAIREGSAGLDAPVAAGHLSGRAFWADQDYHQSFSTLAADRNSERLNRTQDVAARSGGASAEWRRAIGTRYRIAAGFELRQVRGENDEVAIAGETRTPLAVSGRQRLGALSAEGHVGLDQATALTFGLRGDQWKNDDAQRVANGAARALASRSEGALSPRIALARAFGGDWTALASGYRAFRAPTLNELYRSFRVGNVLTQANETLAAERLTGFELALRWSPAQRRAAVRATAFRMDVHQPIANVTVSTTTALIERQRRNLGKTRSQGVELDAEWRLSSSIRLSAAYLWTDADVRSFPADTTLEGRRVPQVPRHGASVQALVTTRALRAWVQARGSDAQYDDDLNQLRLDPFVTIDARLERSVGLAGLFVSVENLGGVRYDVGRTPLRTIGPPRSWRAGVTLDLGQSRAGRN